jgi:hypothetical protein
MPFHPGWWSIGVPLSADCQSLLVAAAAWHCGQTDVYTAVSENLEVDAVHEMVLDNHWCP